MTQDVLASKNWNHVAVFGNLARRTRFLALYIFEGRKNLGLETVGKSTGKVQKKYMIASDRFPIPESRNTWRVEDLPIKGET
jgi:hypothetical protein